MAKIFRIFKTIINWSQITQLSNILNYNQETISNKILALMIENKFSEKAILVMLLQEWDLQLMVKQIVRIIIMFLYKYKNFRILNLKKNEHRWSHALIVFSNAI